MHSVLLLGEISGHRNERLDAEDTARVLVILRELAEDREQLLDYVLLVQLGCENSKFGSANTADHRCVFLTELHELFAETFLLGI